MKFVAPYLVTAVLAVASATWAQDGTYAPGATGDIPPEFIEALDRAEELAREWQQKLTIQEPAKWDLPIDLDAARRKALNHPRVRALLGADDEVLPTEAARPRWDDAQVFAFASFSMPDAALRNLLAQGQAFGVPVVFRGFLNNSVYDTRDALLRIFGSDEAIEGFIIDPTLYARFDVQAVPVFVATDKALTPCASAGCEDETPLPHDLLAGNVTLPFALDVFARGGGEGAEIAGEVRARSDQW